MGEGEVEAAAVTLHQNGRRIGYHIHTLLVVALVEILDTHTDLLH